MASDDLEGLFGGDDVDVIWTIVQGIGSIVGLLTGIYILRETYAKNRPISSFSVSRYMGHGHPTVHWTVENRSERPLLVEIADASRQGYFSLATGSSSEEIFAYVDTGTTTVTVDAHQKLSLILLEPPSFDEMNADSVIIAEVRWRFVPPILYRGSFRLRQVIDKRDYQAIVAGKSKAAAE